MHAFNLRRIAFALLAGLSGVAAPGFAAPRVVLISLDGAKPDLIEKYLATGVLDRHTGLGRLKRCGIHAGKNITATPSLTAVSHIAIATGSTAVHNDIPLNSFHPVAAPIGTTISGFAAPIGGYQISPLGPSAAPTAEPLWVTLRQAGRQVVTATWPGSDGADIRISETLVQDHEPARITDYTVPFGTFGGLGAQGFRLTAGDFGDDDGALAAQLEAAGTPSFSPVKVSGALETFYCAPTTAAACGTSGALRTLRFTLRTAAIDTTDDARINYDTLVFFNADAPAPQIPPGPFQLPATGAAHARMAGPSARFYLEGTGNRVGTAFFVSHLAPDLSTVRFARYAANYLPPNPPVLDAVEDIHGQVGFWAPQPDFRIPERLSPGFTDFPDAELEAMYEDQVASFTHYQTRVGLRAITRNPAADLVMIYLEQPDGSGHQFTLSDPRQATDFTDPRSIGRPNRPAGATGQDPAKIARYEGYLRLAYQSVNRAVQSILEGVGADRDGKPLSDVFVVSDHGMAPFHTAVNLRNLLTNAGIDTNLLNIRWGGPAADLYVNLQGREAGGAVAAADYPTVLAKIADVLRNAADPNAYYNPAGSKLFSQVWTRPLDCGRPAGFCTDENIGQDSGDVVALMAEGYNFDGTQNPAVVRLGDDDRAVSPVYSVPNFYGAHGYDSRLPSMSAILYAAGPSLMHRRIPVVQNIDIAPTILEILGVAPAPTVDGTAIDQAIKP